MNDGLKAEAIKHGDRLQITDVKHLEDLRRDIEEFKETEELNSFQQWIVNNLYCWHLPETGFDIRTIIILATHHPFYADIEFTYSGKVYYTRSLVHPEYQEANSYVKEALEAKGYHICEEKKLPFKRLAVQSGLAEYGRNNITYVEGLGSNFNYMAFFSDVPCDKDEWRKVCHAEVCDTCNACIMLCPTGAIRSDRFLIDNSRCLSSMNEMGGKFPKWLSKDVHHTLYDCLRCQEHCPMNKEVIKDTIGPFRFTEEETSLLLAGKGPEAFSDEFRRIADKIGLFDWPKGLPRNIRAIIDSVEE